MLHIQNIQKKYQLESREHLALANVSMHVQKGDFLAIMGQSGCGKSTLLNIMGFLDTATKGEILFLGENVSIISEKKRAEIRKKHIGFIFQSFNLIDELTIFENIELPLTYLNIDRKDRKKRVLEVLEELSLTHRADFFPQQLSGGQQQKVAIGRAIIAKPELILADEPTGNLDSKNSQIIMQLLQKLNENGTTIIMVTHSAKDAGCASRIIRLFDGQIVSEKFQETE